MFYSKTPYNEQQTIALGRDYLWIDGTEIGPGFTYSYQNGVLTIYPASGKAEYYIYVCSIKHRDVFVAAARELIGIRIDNGV